MVLARFRGLLLLSEQELAQSRQAIDTNAVEQLLPSRAM